MLISKKRRVLFAYTLTGVNLDKEKLSKEDIIVEGCQVRDKRLFVTNIYVASSEVAQEVCNLLKTISIVFSQKNGIRYGDWGTINICVQGQLPPHSIHKHCKTL